MSSKLLKVNQQALHTYSPFIYILTEFPQVAGEPKKRRLMCVYVWRGGGFITRIKECVGTEQLSLQELSAILKACIWLSLWIHQCPVIPYIIPLEWSLRQL